MKFEYEAIHKFDSALPVGVIVGLTVDQYRRRVGKVKLVNKSKGEYETLQVIRFKNGERFKLKDRLKERSYNLFFRMTAPSEDALAKIKAKEDKEEKARLEAEADERAEAKLQAEEDEADAQAEAELQAEEDAKAKAKESGK